MGSTASKPTTKFDLDKNRHLRSSATVGCEKSEEDIVKPTVVNGNYNFKKQRKMRLSALLPQQLNNHNNMHDSHANTTTNSIDNQQQPQQQQQKKKKKLKEKKHNVKSISAKRNAKYKRVTKSIIGKPSNFQHMGHVGMDQQFTPRTIRHVSF